MSQEESAPSAQRAAQPARLAELQLAGRLTAPPLFTSVPRSCQAQVQSLVDADGDLKSKLGSKNASSVKLWWAHAWCMVVQLPALQRWP